MYTLHLLSAFNLYFTLCCILIFSANSRRLEPNWRFILISKNTSYSDEYGLYKDGHDINRFESALFQQVNIQRTRLESQFTTSFAIVRTTKHGNTCLILPSKPFEIDLTICVDISSTPGPNFLSQPTVETVNDTDNQHIQTQIHLNTIAANYHNYNYSKTQLLAQRRYDTGYSPCQIVMNLNQFELLQRTRAIRNGKLPCLKSERPISQQFPICEYRN